MKDYLKHVVQSYFDSYNNNDKGWSRKKILASIIVFVTMIIEIHWIWVADHTFQQLESVLIINFASANALLGIGAIQSIKKKSIDTPNKTTINASVTSEKSTVTETKETPPS